MCMKVYCMSASLSGCMYVNMDAFMNAGQKTESKGNTTDIRERKANTNELF